MVQQASTGITCISSSPEILSSDISRNGTGIFIQGGSSHPLFRSTSVEFNQKAGVHIEHASTALLIQAGSAEIASCQILTGLQSGIECSGQSASKITRSRIAGHKTGTGIICSGYAKPFLRANNIVDNAWAVVSYMNLLADARANWWGSDPPAEGLIMGQVDYSSWLKAENSDHP